MPELLLKDEVYNVAGAAMEVYYQLGTGFLEAIYQEALEIELNRRSIPFESQQSLTLEYKGQRLGRGYVADLVCYGQIIVELKVVDRLTNIEVAQLINYLKVTKLHVGLLFNFGSLVLRQPGFGG
ncbi:MAG: GxxExxY protein [Acidobacteria bacterium]|nr:GxxExxY protein [Acidobacteriota bacterium]